MIRSQLRGLLALLLLGSFLSDNQACDACGCGVGSSGFGLLGIYRANYLSYQYSYAGFRALQTSGEPTGTEDAFFTHGLSLRYQLLPRWRLEASQNWHHNTRTGAAGDQLMDGMGDLRLGLAYSLLQDQPLWGMTSLYLEVGGQLALPTGRFEGDLLEDYFLADNFSPGRGAVAFIPSMAVQLSGAAWGLSLQAQGQLHGRSSNDYRWGDEVRFNASVFRQIPLGEMGMTTFIPYAGLQYEGTSASKNRFGDQVHATGGEALQITIGAQMRLERFSLGVSAGQILTDNYASGTVEARGRLAAEINYQF